MLKNPILYCFVLLWSAILGCGDTSQHPVHITMKDFSNAIHARDLEAVRALLSSQTTDDIDEVFTELDKLYSASKQLPEVKRVEVANALPKSVKTGDRKNFLAELTNGRLSTLRLNPQTAYGLEIDEIQQENDTSAVVTTKSGQRFTFTKEKQKWKIHLFKSPLTKLLTQARQQQQAIALTIQRTKRRVQIRTVLESVKSPKP